MSRLQGRGRHAPFSHPWQLAGEHASASCEQCHVSAAKPDPSCRSCHKQDVALHAAATHARTDCATCHGAAVTGWNGVLPQACASCHTDRGTHYVGNTCESCHTFTGRGAKFEHAWPLTGKHQSLDCQSCHTSDAKPNPNCASCHSQSAGLHASATHSGSQCATCHGTSTSAWQGVSRETCANCHSDKQNHFASQTCNTCHSFTGQAVRYQHAWPLNGKHASVGCASCHTSDAKPDPSCKSCHNQGAGLHASGAHAGTSCDSCHGSSPSAWQGVSQATCAGCHADKQGHFPTQTCATCHSFTGQAAGYQHAWPLSGKHASVGCASCHTGSGKPDPNCASCHQQTGGALHAASTHTNTSCQTCHGTSANGWSGVGRPTCVGCHGDKSTHFVENTCQTCHSFTPRGTTFQHPWPLSGKHQTAACGKCHTSSAKPSTSCASCHKPPGVDLHKKDKHINNSCQTCHGTSYENWSVPRQACLNCHGNDDDYAEKEQHRQTTALCSSCHRFK